MLYGSLLEFVFYKRMYENKVRSKFLFLERLKIKITRLLSRVFHSHLSKVKLTQTASKWL